VLRIKLARAQIPQKTTITLLNRFTALQPKCVLPFAKLCFDEDFDKLESGSRMDCKNLLDEVEVRLSHVPHHANQEYFTTFDFVRQAMVDADESFGFCRGTAVVKVSPQHLREAIAALLVRGIVANPR